MFFLVKLGIFGLCRQDVRDQQERPCLCSKFAFLDWAGSCLVFRGWLCSSSSNQWRHCPTSVTMASVVATLHPCFMLCFVFFLCLYIFVSI